MNAKLAKALESEQAFCSPSATSQDASDLVRGYAEGIADRTVDTYVTRALASSAESSRLSVRRRPLESGGCARAPSR